MRFRAARRSQKTKIQEKVERENQDMLRHASKRYKVKIKDKSSDGDSFYALGLVQQVKDTQLNDAEKLQVVCGFVLRFNC